MKAKLINNVLEYPTEFMFIKSEGNWVSNPTDEQLSKDGYKEVIEEYDDISEIIFVENNINIIRKIPIPLDLGEDNTNILNSMSNEIDTESEYDNASIEEKKSIFIKLQNYWKSLWQKV